MGSVLTKTTVRVIEAKMPLLAVVVSVIVKRVCMRAKERKKGEWVKFDISPNFNFTQPLHGTDDEDDENNNNKEKKKKKKEKTKLTRCPSRKSTPTPPSSPD